MVKYVNNKIKIILDKLIDNGYEAYIVGGFVRDYLLGIESYDVDIATSAKPIDVIDIFSLNNGTEDNYGSVYIKDKLYNYDITTYRKELKYEDRKPIEYEYASFLEEDIIRRDFTINSMYMSNDGSIIDIYNGKKDLEDKIIRCIGDIETKMTEDPLRMLRAIRFASIFDFKIEDELKTFIINHKELLNNLSYTRKKEELDKIFKSNNVENGIKLIKELDIEEYLGIKIKKNISNCIDYLGIWSQIEFSSEYPFKISEKENIELIRKILKYGIIDNVIIYKYGLYASVIAASILGYSRSYVSELYKNMPIYTDKDININGDEIQEILNINPSSIISDIYVDLELKILNGIISNTKEDIKKYLKENWRK